MPYMEWENIYLNSPNASLYLNNPPRLSIILPKLSSLEED
jgi:hypothetical protein